MYKRAKRRLQVAISARGRGAETALAFLALGLLFPLITSAGCAGKPISASTLPENLQATVTPGVERLPLGQLASAWSASDVVYAGDTLHVLVTTGIEETAPRPWMVRVGPNGVAEVPVIGSVQIAGLRFPQAEAVVRSEGVRRGMYVNPTVSLSLASRATKHVTVVGEVREQGAFDVPAVNASVLAAIMEAKGLTEDAGLHVEVSYPPTLAAGAVQQVRHVQSPGRTVRLNLADVAAGRTSDFELQDGATITVLKRPLNTFQVIGLVRKPNQFEMEPDHEYRLLEAIAMAGDRTLQIADKVHVIRRAPNQSSPVVIEASISEAKSNGDANLLLAPGDVVSVEETPATFTVGTIREFIRFGFSAAIPGF